MVVPIERLWRRVLLVCGLAAVIAGCQSAPEGVEGRYYTWVDAAGQVRHSRMGPEASGESAPERNSPLIAEGAGEADESATGTESPDSDSPYDLAHYPDGNRLAEQGFLREGDPLPYFSWTDASGQRRITRYRPGSASDTGGDTTVLDIGFAPDGALVLRPERSDMPRPNPEALATMGVQPGRDTAFGAWRDACCTELELGEAIPWEDREFPVRITDASQKHRFETGESRFGAVRLPQTPSVFILRSYIRKGVFVPSLAFLDSELRVTRVVTDIPFRLVPESWSSYGYLETRMATRPGERWMILHTTDQAIRGQTVDESGKRPRPVAHVSQGVLAIEPL